MRRIKLIICLAMILILGQMVQGEDVLKISDKGYVSLSLDAIRTGIQRQDINRVMTVIGPSVLIQGANQKSNDSVAQILEQIFANSSKREVVTGKRALPPSGLATESNLWDFDILSRKVTVNGDSAIVECELVLWGATPTGTSKVGSKVIERMVFWSPAENQSGTMRSSEPLRWKLVECKNLFDFLKNYGAKSTQKDNADGGQR